MSSLIDKNSKRRLNGYRGLCLEVLLLVTAFFIAHFTQLLAGAETVRCSINFPMDLTMELILLDVFYSSDLYYRYGPASGQAVSRTG